MNDATIGRDERGGGPPLIADIEEAAAANSFLLANVNRGILFEELAGAPADGIGVDIVRWLREQDCQNGRVEEFEARTSYLRVARIAGTGTLLIAVYMDACSLFEVRPDATLASGEAQSISIEAEPYEILRFKNRSTLELRSIAGGEVLCDFLDSMPPPEVSTAADPFAANLQSLRAPGVRTGVITVLRAAEIAAGQLFTYRELWGAITRLIVGDAHIDHAGDDLLELVPASDKASPRELARLANYRFHQGLFGVSRLPGQAETSRPDPVTALTRLVDPVRDARPGTGKLAGWADPVLRSLRRPRT